MVESKEHLASEVTEKIDKYLGIKLKSLSKMTKEDLDLLNQRIDRAAEKPGELFASLAHNKIRDKIDDAKDNVKARVAARVEEFLDKL
jgi:hypothetical protein